MFINCTKKGALGEIKYLFVCIVKTLENIKFYVHALCGDICFFRTFWFASHTNNCDKYLEMLIQINITMIDSVYGVMFTMEAHIYL